MPAAPARRVVAVGTPALDDATGAGVGTKNRIFLQAVPQSLSSMPHPLLHPLSAPGACITRIQFLVLSVPTDVLYIYVINLVTTNQSVSLARIPYLRTQVRRKKKFNGIALIVTLVHSITFLCTILHFL